MITDSVIKEIYKKFGKRKQALDRQQMEYFINLLSEHHSITDREDCVIINKLEEFNPFRRFLKRNLHAILEFDKEVAFVFPTHILFLSKESDNISIHIRLEEKKSFFQRLFGR